MLSWNPSTNATLEPKSYLRSSIYLLGEWSHDRFSDGAGSRLCIFFCLVGVALFAVPVGIVVEARGPRLLLYTWIWVLSAFPWLRGVAFVDFVSAGSSSSHARPGFSMTLRVEHWDDVGQELLPAQKLSA